MGWEVRPVPEWPQTTAKLRNIPDSVASCKRALSKSDPVVDDEAVVDAADAAEALDGVSTDTETKVPPRPDPDNWPELPQERLADRTEDPDASTETEAEAVVEAADEAAEEATDGNAVASSMVVATVKSQANQNLVMLMRQQWWDAVTNSTAQN